MIRPIPGTVEVEGREFMYIESDASESFRQISDSVFSLGVALAMPKAGGVLEEKVRIKLKDGISFVGISYRGDIEGWRKRYIDFCKATGRRYGFINNLCLVISTGETFSLENLVIDFEK